MIKLNGSGPLPPHPPPHSRTAPVTRRPADSPAPSVSSVGSRPQSLPAPRTPVRGEYAPNSLSSAARRCRVLASDAATLRRQDDELPFPPHLTGDFSRPFQFAERWFLAHVIDTSLCPIICGSQRNGCRHVLHVAPRRAPGGYASAKMMWSRPSAMRFTTG